MLGHEFFAPHHWRRRIVLWVSAIIVALASIQFAKASDWAYRLFQDILSYRTWIPMLLTSAVFGLLAWVNEGVCAPLAVVASLRSLAHCILRTKAFVRACRTCRARQIFHQTTLEAHMRILRMFYGIALNEAQKLLWILRPVRVASRPNAASSWGKV